MDCNHSDYPDLSPDNNPSLYKYLTETIRNFLPSREIAFVYKLENHFSVYGNISLSDAILSLIQKTEEKGCFAAYDQMQAIQFGLKESILCTMIQKNEQTISLYLLVFGSEGSSLFSESNIQMIKYFTKYMEIILDHLVFCRSREGNSLSYMNDLSTSIHFVSELLKYRLSSVKYDNQLNEFINVSGLINSSLHLNDVLEAVMFSAKSVFSTESCSLMLLDEKKEFLYFHTIAGEKKEEISKIRVPVGQGIAGLIALSKKPMIINDAQKDPRVYRKVDTESNFVTRNILGAPLIANDDVIGVIEAINTIGRDHFDDSDIELFVSFSDAVALAIQRTGLLDSLERTNRELKRKIAETESLFELGQAVVESKDINELFLSSVNIIAEQLDCHRAAIVIIDDSREKINITALIDSNVVKFQDTFFRDSIIINSIINNRVVLNASGELFHEDNLDDTLLFNSYVIIPLVLMERRPIGVVCISDNRNGHIYGENEVRLLKTMSAQVIKGYETFRLYENTIAKREMEKELEVTRKIQNNILPDKVNFNSNFELGFLFKPAKEVSGDFYDFFQFDNGIFSTLVADVSGKSLPAAIFMAMSSSTIRAFSRRKEYEPSKILEKANELIFEDSHSGMFVTTFFLQYYPSRMMIHYASAGHNEQFLLKKDGTFQILKTRGLPLGVIQSGKYTGGQVSVEPDDILVLYTDGVVEEKDLNFQEFGLSRLIDEIKINQKLPPQILAEIVYQKVFEFRGKQEQYDDFTLIIMKFNDDFQYRKLFAATSNQIPEFREYVYQIIKSTNCSEAVLNDVLLACDEAATNIVMHAYANTELKNPKFEVFVRVLEQTIKIKLVNWGIEFDRNAVTPPSLEANLKGKKKGGFGVFLIEKLMDHVEYLFQEKTNVLIMEKKLISFGMGESVPQG